MKAGGYVIKNSIGENAVQKDLRSITSMLLVVLGSVQRLDNSDSDSVMYIYLREGTSHASAYILSCHPFQEHQLNLHE